VLGANLVGQAIVALGGLGTLLAVAKSTGGAFRPETSEIKALLAGGAQLHLNAVGTYLFTSTNVLILNQYHGPAQTGHFQLATQLVGVLMIVPQSASMVIYGKVASLGPNAAWPTNRRLLLQVTAGMILLSGLAAIFGPPLISLLAGDRFLPAVPIFRWLLLGLIGMTFSTVMAPQWIGRGYLWQAALTSLVLGLANLGANLLLIPRGGMQSAVIVFIGTYTACMIVNAVMALWCQIQIKRESHEVFRPST
jgi:O-antigen/teichoic acid export membrane protein